MTLRRVRLLTILAGATLGALTLLSWTQQWFSLTLTDATTVTATGQVAAPALSALGLASLALAAALSIAGSVVRVVLGLLQAAIGVCVALSAAIALGAPVAASSSVVTGATGVSGTLSVAGLVGSVSVTAWPYVAIVVGALAALVGFAVLATSHRWPRSTRKYETDGSAAATPAGAWDALSEGHDPTSTP